MNKLVTIFLVAFVLLGSFALVAYFLVEGKGDDLSLVDTGLGESEEPDKTTADVVSDKEPEEEPKETPATELHPMSIESLRAGMYPGGDFVFEESLANGTNYEQHIVSYLSEGCKIFGLLTVPLELMPESGFQAVVFVHGYIQPEIYSTTGDYPTYQARLARSGVVTFKPDLRGHGNSECEPESAHFSEAYVVDTLNAIEYMKDYEKIDEERIGYWGHSNGGEIGLRVLVVDPSIKAASLWAGVVGSYESMWEMYRNNIPFFEKATSTELIKNNGLPSENPEFWSKLEPYNYLDSITAKVQLQHASGDASVPIVLSQELETALLEAGKEVEYFIYEGDDHNIGANSSLAWQRTIDFFDENL